MTPKHRIKRLYQLIKDLGLSNQKALAKALDVDASYLSQLINGHRMFNDTVARNFEEKLDLTPFYFELEFNTDSSNATDNTKPTNTNSDRIAELNRFRGLVLGESCQLNPKTIATRVIGGWIYTIKHSQAVDGKITMIESSSFVPFTTQYDLDGMVNELINTL